MFKLLSEANETLIFKTLGLIRNLLCGRVHIDQIMSVHGNKIIQAMIMVLESEGYSNEAKEQALCVLANIADGQRSKDFIISNEDLLRKINSFLVSRRLNKNYLLIKSIIVLY